MPTVRLGFERSQVEALETAAEIIRVMAESDESGFASIALVQISDTVDDVATALCMDMAANEPDASLVTLDLRFEEIMCEPAPVNTEPIIVLDHAGITALPIGTVIEAVDFFPHRFEKVEETVWIDLAMDRRVGEPGFGICQVWMVANADAMGFGAVELVA